jgi:hypothetical protein
MKKVLLAVLCVMLTASFVFAAGAAQQPQSGAAQQAPAKIVLPSGAVLSTGPHGEQASAA